MFVKPILFSIFILIASATVAQQPTLDSLSIGRFALNTNISKYKDSLIAFFRDSASDFGTHYKEFVFTGVTDKNPIKLDKVHFSLPIFRTDTAGVIKAILLNNVYSSDVNSSDSPKKTARNAMLFLYNYFKDNWPANNKPERRIVKHKIDMIEYRWRSKESYLILRRTVDKKINTVSVLLQVR